MTILAIETTGSTCGVCIGRTDADTAFQLLTLHELYREHVHDAQLAQLIEHSLHSSGLTISDIDVVAVSGGPGSFTGTRIGLALSKGLCFTNAPRLLVIDTMHALAEASREVAIAAEASAISVVIPSHRELVYHAVYPEPTADGPLRRNDADVQLGSIADVRGHAEHMQAERALIVGPGAALVADRPISGLSRLSSRFVALRAAQELRSGTARYSDPQTATPLYRQEFVGRTA